MIEENHKNSKALFLLCETNAQAGGGDVFTL
jgi:hypothetical protein